MRRNSRNRQNYKRESKIKCLKISYRTLLTKFVYEEFFNLRKKPISLIMQMKIIIGRLIKLKIQFLKNRLLQMRRLRVITLSLNQTHLSSQLKMHMNLKMLARKKINLLQTWLISNNKLLHKMIILEMIAFTQWMLTLMLRMRRRKNNQIQHLFKIR